MIASDTPPVPRVALVQVLRGVAAMLVLLGHVQGALIAVAGAGGARPWTLARLPGGFGVDLFFCISGFIIVTSSGGFAGRPGGRRDFLRKRLVRLVPLYWLFTLLFLPLLFAGHVAPRGHIGAALLASLFFVPHAAVIGPAGVFPVYDLGWSLNFEMFFYAVFALCLGGTLRAAAAGAAAMLTVVVVAGLVHPVAGAIASVWTAPILLEFVLGILVAVAFLSPRGLPGAARAARAALVAAASALLALDPFGLTDKAPGAVTPNDLVRVLGWGVPACLVLAAAVFTEKARPGRRLPRPLRWAERVGDASYSLYLAHPLVVIVLVKLWSVAVPAPFRAAGADWPCLGLLLVAASLAAGLAVHRAVERPLTAFVGRVLRGRVGARAAPTRATPTPGPAATAST